MMGMKEEEKNLPQVLFYVLKSCEKSTKCPYRFVFKSWFVMCSLSTFYFKVSHISLLHHPHDSQESIVAVRSHATVGHFLMYLESWFAVQIDMFEVC